MDERQFEVSPLVFFRFVMTDGKPPAPSLTPRPLMVMTLARARCALVVLFRDGSMRVGPAGPQSR